MDYTPIHRSTVPTHLLEDRVVSSGNVAPLAPVQGEAITADEVTGPS